MEEWRGNSHCESWFWHIYRSKMNLNCVLKSKLDKIITMIFRWIPFSITINSIENSNNDVVFEYMKIFIDKHVMDKANKIVHLMKCCHCHWNMMISFVTESNEKFAWNIMLKASCSLSNLLLSIWWYYAERYLLYSIIRIPYTVHRTPYIVCPHIIKPPKFNCWCINMGKERYCNIFLRKVNRTALTVKYAEIREKNNIHNYFFFIMDSNYQIKWWYYLKYILK